MNLSQLMKSAALLTTAIVFVGCAQLSPQRVDFSPSLATEGLIRGEGSTSLLVEDNRADKVIGYRGGVYSETSTIQALRPLDQVIEALAKEVLSRANIEVSEMFPNLNMTISLDKLSYITEDERPTVKRTTAMAAVSITVRKGATTFENGYSTSQYIETVGYPSDERNAELLNDVFESVLQRLFSDEALETFIRS